MTRLIPTFRFTTADLPVTAQFAAFSSHSGNSHVSRPGPGDAPFAADATFWALDGIVLSEQRVDPFNFDRPEAMVRATTSDHFQVVAIYEGETRVIADDVDVGCRRGDVLIIDLTRPAASRSTGQHSIALQIARSFLLAATGAAAPSGRLPSTPETAILSQFLLTLAAQLPDTRADRATTLSRILRDLIANAIGTVAPEPRASSSLRARATAYIAAAVSSLVEPERMARDLGIARSTLFRLFKADGGVLAYQRSQRLRAVHRALSDPLDRRSIAAIGHAAGFDDPAHLARLFRSRFGYSMRELRLHAGSALSEATADVMPAALRYRQAIAALS